MREKWPYIRRKIYLILLLVSFVLGVHGLYVYYRPVIHQNWQLLSAMLYGTMKLYLFSPPLAATAEVSLSYEIAKWLAPLLTSALVLTALTNRVLHLKNITRNLFGDHLLVFGVNEESETFLASLKKEKNPLKRSIISLSSISDEKKQGLERSGVAVYRQDPRELSLLERKAFAKQVRLSKSSHILLLHQDQRVNYQLFMTLLPLLQLNKRTKVHVKMSNATLMDYVLQSVEARKEKEESLSLLDLHFFDLESLSIELLLAGDGGLHFLRKQLEAIEKGGSFLDEVPQVHLLLFGMNSLTKQLILRSVNDFVMGREKIKISLLGEGASLELENFLYENPMLEEALDLQGISTMPGRIGFREAIAKGKGKFTAAFLNHPDPLVNLEVLKHLPQDLPIALRNEEELNFNELRPLYPNLRFFGSLKDTMKSRIVLQESLDQAARQFNQRYDEVASILGSGGSSWEKLSPTKKRSSRLSAAHNAVKEAIALKWTEESEEVLVSKLWKQQDVFKDLVREKQDQAFKEGLLAFFRENPLLRDLSELEHRRWCNSYYAMGYRQAKRKDEVEKTHPCLNPSWEFLMEEGFFSCHPEYDLISALSMFGESHEKK